MSSSPALSGATKYLLQGLAASRGVATQGLVVVKIRK